MPSKFVTKLVTEHRATRNMSDSNRYSVAEAAALMDSGKLTATRLAEDCLARVAERERDVEAWVHIDPERVLAQARACDREPRCGPLHGIPVGIKDIIDTADLPTEYGSPIYAGHRPRWDAACVAMLRSAGAIIMGKTVTVEFAMGQPGKTRNPHHPEHTPGGSSSGSAAAVADFMVPLALGTQTGGSVIRPAAYCGIVGFKPTFNVINRAGVIPVGESLDTVGTLSRTVADARIAFSLLTRSGAADFGTPGAGKPRIGFCRTPQWRHVEQPAVQALEKAVPALARAGARIEEVTLPERFDEMLAAHDTLFAYEGHRARSHERRAFPDKISPHLTAWLEQAGRRALAEYCAARQVAADCHMLLRRVFSDYDLLLAPSAPGEPPHGLQKTGDSILNRIWTSLHVPAITVPAATSPAGLPIGVQLVGPFGADYRLLAHAEWVQLALAQQ